MGTRGAIIIKIKNLWYIIYNHFDSYPSGLLKRLINELSDYDGLKKMYLEQIEKNGNGDEYTSDKSVDNYGISNELSSLNISKLTYHKNTETMMNLLTHGVDHEYSYFIDFDSCWIGCSHVSIEPIIYATSNIKNEQQMNDMYDLFHNMNLDAFYC